MSNSFDNNSNEPQEYDIPLELPDDAYGQPYDQPIPNESADTGGSNRGAYVGAGGVLAVLLTLILGYFGLDIDLTPTEQSPADNAPIETETTNNTDNYEDVSATRSDDSFFYEIFFTEATCPKAEDRSGGVDELIAQSIDDAQFQVDIASFDLDSEPIIDALIAAEEAELLVRVVVDNAHTPAGTINRLRRNGISVIEDKRAAFMHNKFVILDGQTVWTGSMNFAENGVYCNNNNVVLLDAPALAANYTAEMDEMYNNSEFGPTSSRNTENRLNLGGIQVENYFASESEVARSIARVVARAESEILFMAFSFTNEDIGEAMIERADDGVVVRGVFEKNGASAASAYFNDFRRARLDTIEVRKDGNSRIMHHKVIIVDREITIFGSFNFSNNANDNNDENVLIVYDPEFTTAFIDEFDLVWAEAEE